MLRTHSLGYLPAVLLRSVALVTPFDPGKAGWKMNADGTAIETKDGNPIWVDVNGAESTLGGDTIARLNAEAMGHRTRAETAEKNLKTFEGIDPTKAREALDMVSKLDQKKLIDAGEVDKVRAQITEQYTGQIAEKDKKIGELSNNVNTMKLDSAFSKSDFFKDKVALPLDVAQTYFNKFVSFDDAGNMVIKGPDGNQVRSKTKIGEVADFDEAFSLITADLSNRDQLLKGNNHQGSGNQGGGGGGKPGQKVYRRSELDAMSTTNAQGAAAAMAEVNAGTATLSD